MVPTLTFRDPFNILCSLFEALVLGYCLRLAIESRRLTQRCAELDALREELMGLVAQAHAMRYRISLN